MAGHAQLKFVMTECSKTQIRLTRPNLCLLRHFNCLSVYYAVSHALNELVENSVKEVFVLKSCAFTFFQKTNVMTMMFNCCKYILFLLLLRFWMSYRLLCTSKLSRIVEKF